ncbi:MAG: hypothetical protein RQ875_11080 [Vicingaceae bacterium]|nr:hypothetical protein [Vicingaceae bacterium]
MHKFYILLIIVSLISVSAFGQKKNKKTASSSGSSTEVTAKRDAFSGKSKKGPNIEVDGGGSSNKAKSYKHSISRKKVKRKDMKKQAEFSSKKRRHKSTNSKKQKGDATSGKSRSGRKSGK